MAARLHRIDACYVCVYASCAYGGSESLRDGLRQRLAEVDSSERVEEYNCLGYCPSAPNIVLYPEGTWYMKVESTDLEDIISHIQGGEPVERLKACVDPRLHQLILKFMDARIG